MRRRNLFLAYPALIAILAGPAPGQNSQPVSASQVRWELVLGQRLSEDLERRDKRIDDPAIVGYVQQIEDRLANAAAVKPQEVRITRGSELYARLLPQRVLYISGAFLERLESEAELAGLLAHQLAHEPIVYRAPVQGKIPLLAAVCVLGSQPGLVKWRPETREPELTATATAVQTLRAAGYEPSAVLDLLSKLAYEHPAWAKSIVPEDLLTLRVIVESDDPPQGGYLIDSSEFSRQQGRLSVALRPARPDLTVHRLTSPAN